MAYDGKLLARARERLELIRQNNQAEQARRLAEVYGKLPAVERIDGEMREQMSQLVKLTLSRDGELAEKLGKVKEANLDAQMRRAELLCAAGWSVDYLDDIYSCPKCRDTGIFQSAPCDCLVRLYNQELTKELGALLRSGDESFENFDLSLFSDSADPQQGVSPRKYMARVYEICLKYAKNFPDVYSRLFMHGGTGLGKTYLCACIARVVAGKGFSVCYDSAASALDAFEKQKFSRSTEEGEAAGTRVQRMLSCDLMILDDLGTEMITPMSLSALYTLLNTRLVNKKPFIINSNLSPEELERRYTPQIASRITGEFLDLPFAGSDIRKLRREKK